MKLALSGRLFETQDGYTLDLEAFLKFAGECGDDGVQIRYSHRPLETLSAKLQDTAVLLKALALVWILGNFKSARSTDANETLVRVNGQAQVRARPANPEGLDFQEIFSRLREVGFGDFAAVIADVAPRLDRREVARRDAPRAADSCKPASAGIQRIWRRSHRDRAAANLGNDGLEPPVL
jgi:sugar phosphate isomerase/epimerase